MSATLAAAGTALLAAALLGASSVAQRRDMLDPSGSDSDASPSRGLLAGLVLSRWWWVGTLASVGGWCSSSSRWEWAR